MADQTRREAIDAVPEPAANDVAQYPRVNYPARIRQALDFINTNDQWNAISVLLQALSGRDTTDDHLAALQAECASYKIALTGIVNVASSQEERERRLVRCKEIARQALAAQPVEGEVL